MSGDGMFQPAARPSRAPRILVVFVTRRGQTRKIAQVIGTRLRDAGARVDVRTLPRCPSPADYDAVVAGDSVHFSRHSRKLVRYLTRHSEQIATTPTGIFQVSLTSAVNDDAHSARASELLRSLLSQTGLEPDVTGTFAGALQFSRYNWVLRRVVRSVAREEGLDVDGRVDREYTDWADVDRFAGAVWNAIVQ